MDCRNINRPMKRSRTRYHWGFLVAALTSAFAANAWGLDRVRIGMGAFSPTNSAIWVAEERGFFKKHGIEAEAIFIGGGAARGVNALLAGDIQFATAGGGGLITPARQGAGSGLVAGPKKKK